MCKFARSSGSGSGCSSTSSSTPVPHFQFLFILSSLSLSLCRSGQLQVFRFVSLLPACRFCGNCWQLSRSPNVSAWRHQQQQLQQQQHKGSQGIVSHLTKFKQNCYWERGTANWKEAINAMQSFPSNDVDKGTQCK